MTTATDDFKRLGDKASFHYADDSTREWDMANKAKAEALRVFDANPDDQAEMRKIAQGFLWVGEFKRARPHDDRSE